MIVYHKLFFGTTMAKHNEDIILAIASFLVTLSICSSQICDVTERRDCFTSGALVNQVRCEDMSCTWCPSDVNGAAFCIDGCVNAPSAIDVFPSGTINVNQQLCISQGGKYCPSVQPGVPICQTNHLDCLVQGRVDAKVQGTAVTKYTCEQINPIGRYCPHSQAGVPWCIKAQPAAAQCFAGTQPAIASVNTAYECHISGGVWCSSQGPNQNKCIALPTEPSCVCPPPVTYQCIVNANANPTEAECIGSGCRWCVQSGQPSCVYGLTRECQRPDLRVSCSSDPTLTKSQCNALGCDYCPNPLPGVSNCIKRIYDLQCYNENRVPCANINQATVNATTCSAAGCIFCEDRSSQPVCVENPAAPCTNCTCSSKTDCLPEMASNQVNCLAKNCMWCPQDDPIVPDCIIAS